MSSGKHRKEHTHPLDIESDDHSNEHSNPTMLHDRTDDEFDREDIGEDRDNGSPHMEERLLVGERRGKSSDN